MEKRFKIPSQNTGIISVGNDMSQVFAAIFLTYYAGGKHKPKSMSCSLYGIALYCLISALPHFIYGPGEDALQLTEEYKEKFTNSTLDGFFVIRENRKDLCNTNDTFAETCDLEGGNLVPQFILFFAQILFGIGESIYYVFGMSYLDDNVDKAKTPLAICCSYFIKMMGPAIGYGIASFCLKFYIDPTLHPVIDNKDPRWLGCWWLGWIFIAIILILFGIFIGLFPKELSTYQTNKDCLELKENISAEENEKLFDPKEQTETNIPALLSDSNVEKPSLNGLIKALKRISTNKILMLNNFATVFYFFGSMPYWMFGPKYFEIQYRQTASQASFKLGSISFIFTGIGLLLSGLFITKFQPRARYLTGWNVITALIGLFGLIINYYLGCEANDNSLMNNFDEQLKCDAGQSCNCDYVNYSPICGSDNRTYISACHAGCLDTIMEDTVGKSYSNCSCIAYDGFAKHGACPIDCSFSMNLFLIVTYINKFLSSTGFAGNFLLTLRCIEKRDKPLAIGFMLTIVSLFAFIPSPIFFGYNLDKACLLWGSTCTTKGNCWFYDGQKMRFAMNIIGAIFVIIGIFLDTGVWYYSKDIQIFEENIQKNEKHIVKPENSNSTESKANELTDNAN